MALTATVDLTKTPPTLTVVSDKRLVTVTVTSAGDTATGVAQYPITVTDLVRTWKPVSDDGKTAVLSL